MAIPADKPIDSTSQVPEVKKERRKSFAASLVGKFYTGKESEVKMPAARVESEQTRIIGLFVKTTCESQAKKGTPEYVRLQLDLTAKKLLQKEKIASNQEVSLEILTGDSTSEFGRLEEALHKEIEGELLQLKPTERDLIKGLSFKNILRAKLVELLREEKRYPREEIALLNGLGRSRELASNIENAKPEDLATILQQLHEIDPVDLDVPTLAELPVTINNAQILATLWKKLIDDLNKLIKNDLTDKQLDILVQLGRALSHIETFGMSPSLFQRSLKLELDEHCRAKRYPELAELQERLQQKFKASDDKPFCKAHFRGLLLLENYCLARGAKDVGHLTSFEKQFLARFLLNSVGSKELYKRLEITAKDESWLISSLLYAIYSHVTGLGLGKETFSLLANKLDLATKIVLEEKRTLSDTAKLKAEEFGAAYRAHSLWQLLEPLKALGLVAVDRELMAFAEEIQSISDSYSRFEKALLEEVKKANTYKNGDILMMRLKSQVALESKGMSTEMWIMKQFVTESSHGAYLFITKEGQIKVSHVMKEYTSEPFSLKLAFASEGWHLVAHKLLKNDPEPMHWLKEMFQARKMPLSLEEGVDAAYHEGARHFHEDLGDNFANITNSSERQIAAGVADVKPRGHTRSKAREDFTSLHKQFSKETPPEKEMICSEFVSKSTIVGLIEADYKLVDELKAWIMRSVTPPEEVKRRLDLLDARQKQNALVFLEIPFSTKERLKRVHPGRLIELLQARDCIEQIPTSALLTQFIQSAAF